MRKCKKQSFSLIELLAVMAIMAVLLTVMLPGFNNMVKGNSVERETGKLKVALERAQAEAISTRRYVALFLPSKATASIDKVYWLGGSRMAYVLKKVADTGTSTYIFSGWVRDSAWRTSEATAKLLQIITPTYSSSTSRSGLKLTGAAKTPASVPITDFSFSNLQKIYNYEFSSGDLGDSAVIFSPYGGIVGEDNLQFVVAEVIESDDKLLFPTRDDIGPTNYLVLELNRFTGRVHYVSLQGE